VDQASRTLQNESKTAGHRIRIGLIVFLFLTALATLVSQGRVGLVNVASAALILIITLIFFLQLLLKARRAALLLNSGDQPDAREERMPLTEAKTVALPAHEVPQSSVIEQTTRELETAKLTRRGDRE
jgi:hypothetical protein